MTNPTDIFCSQCLQPCEPHVQYLSRCCRAEIITRDEAAERQHDQRHANGPPQDEDLKQLRAGGDEVQNVDRIRIAWE